MSRDPKKVLLSAPVLVKCSQVFLLFNFASDSIQQGRISNLFKVS